LRRGLALAAALLAAPQARAADAGLRCEDWAELDRGAFVIENDVWNKGATPSYRQCIFGGLAPGAPFGWRWRWPGGDGLVRAYPSVIHGFSPWRPASTRSQLPRPVGRLGRITARFATATSATGEGNLAFDLWLVRALPPRPEAIRAEVMIWLERRGQALPGRRLADVDIRGRAYELWVAQVQKWRYFAFVARAPLPEGELRLDSFLRYLAHQGALAREDQLASIELGSEIVGGAGVTTVSRYVLELE
jgi:hypothetical protein